ncbi:hypothetical protein SDC9_188586 [bioreactor metagenome]|uniref:Uncharacterized protein n=1 Tax=bioreactor metagenome TaxID=1076179 RepID=A0A645HR51_9ZZZZ
MGESSARLINFLQVFLVEDSADGHVADARETIEKDVEILAPFQIIVNHDEVDQHPVHLPEFQKGEKTVRRIDNGDDSQHKIDQVEQDARNPKMDFSTFEEDNRGENQCKEIHQRDFHAAHGTAVKLEGKEVDGKNIQNDTQRDHPDETAFLNQTAEEGKKDACGNAHQEDREED